MIIILNKNIERYRYEGGFPFLPLGGILSINGEMAKSLRKERNIIDWFVPHGNSTLPLPVNFPCSLNILP